MRPRSLRAILAIYVALILAGLTALGILDHGAAQLIGLIVTAMIAIGGATGICLAIQARLRVMQRTIDAVIDGDMDHRVPTGGASSEFDQQARAFNRMLDGIDERLGNIKHAAKDVTHELKSPLARLRAKVAALSRRAGGNPLAPDIAEALADIDQMLGLFASLLRLWEIEGGQRRERFADIDLGAVAAEVGGTMAAIADDTGHRLTIDLAGAVPIRGDADLLRQMALNLVENALRHTPPGTHIRLSARIENGFARLVVADNGPGVPADLHPTVRRRFGRLATMAGDMGDARDMDADLGLGLGLGLALVDAIARLHHGALRLEDGAPGLIATIDLPLSA